MPNIYVIKWGNLGLFEGLNWWIDSPQKKFRESVVIKIDFWKNQSKITENYRNPVLGSWVIEPSPLWAKPSLWSKWFHLGYNKIIQCVNPTKKLSLETWKNQWLFGNYLVLNVSSVDWYIKISVKNLLAMISLMGVYFEMVSEIQKYSLNSNLSKKFNLYSAFAQWRG